MIELFLRNRTTVPKSTENGDVFVEEFRRVRLEPDELYTKLVHPILMIAILGASDEHGGMLGSPLDLFLDNMNTIHIIEECILEMVLADIPSLQLSAGVAEESNIILPRVLQSRPLMNRGLAEIDIFDLRKDWTR
jgi:hypothetical protein